jgi:hypothetical protein
MDQSTAELVHRNLMQVNDWMAEASHGTLDSADSPMGEEIYRRLGYDDLFAYRVLGAMPPDA